MCQLVSISRAANPSAEQRLISDLLQGYSRNARPVLNSNHTLKVFFGMEIVQIVNVENRNQIIQTNVWIRQRWDNELLTWHPSNYEGVQTVRLDAKSVWIPDIVLYDSADSVFSGGHEKYKTHVIISKDGSSAWFSPASFRSTCKIDVTYFPFDEQTCYMKFGSWTYTIADVDIQASPAPVKSSKYLKSAEWDLMSATTSRKSQIYACCPEPISDVTIAMTIRRKPLFYAFNLITPCMIMLTMILLGFFLPPESGERITLSITVLLAMAVFLQLVAETLPRNSESIPLLGRFYITIMTEIAVSLMATCWVLNIHHRNSGTTLVVEMPKWVDVIVLRWLAVVLCVRQPPSIPHDLVTSEQDRESKFLHEFDELPDIENAYTPLPSMNGNLSSHNHVMHDRPRNSVTMATNGIPGTCRTVTCLLQNRSHEDHYEKRCVRDIRTIADHTRMQWQIEDNQLRWKHVAMVMDRLFFWIFVLTIFISTMIIFKEKIRQYLNENM
ncbi:neuronal acetylcholine receptor subunit alpha-2 isoform X2 [Nematostella vectensis]|uniref:neuronal acetylcholine receptor subunit alpha-2 isoform X2 n=1 Tax=Nematostella vectensis TaxID=45351 RepID=UPI00138FF64D|nr:neuronal acetylcholine receptor subunit alpha-2 isoform X2 [Nematostella vectensis]